MADRRSAFEVTMEQGKRWRAEFLYNPGLIHKEGLLTIGRRSVGDKEITPKGQTIAKRRARDE